LNFLNDLIELKEAFAAEAEETGKPRLLLTAAVPVGPDSIRGGYDVPAVNNHLDFINLMAYDFHGKWESQTVHTFLKFIIFLDLLFIVKGKERRGQRLIWVNVDMCRVTMPHSTLRPQTRNGGSS